MRLVLVTNIPTPYRIPLWDELNKITSLSVVTIANIEHNRKWKLEKPEYVSSLKSFHFFIHRLDWGFHFTLPFTLFFRLKYLNPDCIVISGYDNYQYWEALFFAKLFKKKTVFWNGSTLLSSRSTNKIVLAIKSFFINKFDAYYTYGTKASEYLLHFGVDSQKIITGINTVDSDFFKSHTSDVSRNKGLKKFLFVGQLIQRKGLKETIIAFSKVKSRNWKLTILGSGPDEASLRKLVSDKHLENHFDFVGFKQKEEILHFFSDSDVLIMPSHREVWGLVLNEGLASGLFCLSSKYAGATFDLIKENINGFIFDPLDIDDFTLKIEKTLLQTLDKQIIKVNFEVSIQNEAQKLLQAALIAVNGTKRTLN